MEQFKSVKELTLEQKKKCDKITSLLLELEKSGVHPMIIDGGGGNGLVFIRCSTSDQVEIGDYILDNELPEEVDECIYSPKGCHKYTIDYLVP